MILDTGRDFRDETIMSRQGLGTNEDENRALVILSRSGEIYRA